MLISSLVIIMFFINSNSLVYADNSETDTGWVNKAFSATSSFLKEKTKDSFGVISPAFTFFQTVVKAINRILIVLLAGISTLALSVTGIRYLASGASPGQRDAAKHSLHTIFIGMAFGFGAFAIWRIAMSIVGIIINSFI